MSSQLLIQTGHIAVLVAVLGLAIGARALASVLRTWIEQTSRTRRLDKALEDSRPNQRPGIILACSQLEGKAAGAPEAVTADEVFQAHGQPPSPVSIPQNKRGHKRRRD